MTKHKGTKTGTPKKALLYGALGALASTVVGAATQGLRGGEILNNRDLIGTGKDLHTTTDVAEYFGLPLTMEQNPYANPFAEQSENATAIFESESNDYQEDKDVAASGRGLAGKKTASKSVKLPFQLNADPNNAWLVLNLPSVTPDREEVVVRFGDNVFGFDVKITSKDIEVTNFSKNFVKMVNTQGYEGKGQELKGNNWFWYMGYANARDSSPATDYKGMNILGPDGNTINVHVGPLFIKGETTELGMYFDQNEIYVGVKAKGYYPKVVKDKSGKLIDVATPGIGISSNIFISGTNHALLDSENGKKIIAALHKVTLVEVPKAALTAAGNATVISPETNGNAVPLFKITPKPTHAPSNPKPKGTGH